MSKIEQDGSDDSSGGPTTTKEPIRLYHYQLGAPSLIYYANRTADQWLSPYRIPSSDLPADSARTWHDDWTRKSRIQARWEYPSLGMDKVNEVSLPANIRTGRGKGKTAVSANEDENAVKDLAKARLMLLVQDDFTKIDRSKELILNYTAYEQPYQEVKMGFRDKHHRKRNVIEPRLKPVDYAKSQEFNLQHELHSDPSYLAPFDLEGLKEATGENELQMFRKRVQGDGPPRLPQGNTLLACRCTCPPCSQRTPNNNSSIVLIHPKGPLSERICASNLIPPLGRGNAGHIRPNVQELKYMSWDVYHQYPNEIDLDDTILEIQQSSVWDVDNPRCLLTVRTGTHVSLVSIECVRPEVQDRYAFDDETLCWGCYVLEERERLDFRSISRKAPSLQPISLASHPKYGNPFVPSKIAMVCHSMGNYNTQNAIYSCNTCDGNNVTPRRHDITNLKTISLVDFTTNHPMCLWSAAASYVRPALAANAIAKLTRQAKGAFGFGTSLYTIDLRSNSGTFQWSPSAEEMMTEGVHSISGIMTDWERDSSVWVTSMSAGKTWEIDGRMPAKAVTCWSLTSGCDDFRHIVVPKHGFHGEPSLLVSTLDFAVPAGCSNLGGSPFVRVNTDYGVSGIHMYQRPLRQPRFQAQSLEAIATPGIDFSEHSSIATSSYFAIPDSRIDSYVCGLASLRLPFQSFLGEQAGLDADAYGENPNILCNLTIDNSGDIFCHSILENTGGVLAKQAIRCDDLPIGTKAVQVPKEFDGKLAEILPSGHQKPTCGMNLKLFLTNQYFIARKSLLVGEDEEDRARNGIVVPATKKVKVDDGDVAEIASVSAGASAVAIQSTNWDNPILQDGENLKFPAKLARLSSKPIQVYDKKQGNDAEDSDDSYFGEKRGRSDLSSAAIQETLRSWDDHSTSSDS